MKKTTLLLAVFALYASTTIAQTRNSDVWEEYAPNPSNIREEIIMPSVDGLIPLKGDFHVHTIFSDGEVSPKVRVREAWQNGLDVIAITDHIEYRPYKDYIVGDLNTPYLAAKKMGDEMGMLVVQGTEITKNKPFGHMNAIFIKDANKVANNDPVEAVKEAVRQGGFVFWNHPGWPDNKCDLYPVHEELIAEGLVKGIEVVNMYTYYPKAFDWCNKYNLTFLSNTDTHQPIAIEYGNETPPYTLLFAESKSLSGVRKALDSGMSVAVFNNQIAGDVILLKKILLAALEVKQVTASRVEVTNTCDIPIIATCNNQLIEIAPRTTIGYTMPSQDVEITIENFFTGSNTKLKVWGRDLLQ